ncbi:MAG: hypothetical protein WC254_06430 [Candidatus Woesearchaeota archaeon]|jgi:hypothetical protein
MNEDFEEKIDNSIMTGVDIMKKFRGEIIEMALQIDYILDDIISNYFSKETKKKNIQFREKILSAKPMGPKTDMFLFLKLHENNKFEKKFDALPYRLKNFITARNKFAHNLRESYHHEFKGYWKGKECIIKLNDEFLKEIDDEFQYLVKSLKYIQLESGLLLNWDKYEELDGSDDNKKVKQK